MELSLTEILAQRAVVEEAVLRAAQSGTTVAQSTGYDQQLPSPGYSSLDARIRTLERSVGTSTIPIHTLESDKWEIRKPPLTVAVEQRGADNFVACLYDVDLYGYGETIPDAIDDLKAIILDQFEYLSERQHTIRLGSMPKRQLEFLKSVLVSTDA